MLLEFDSAMETLVIVEQYRDEFCYRVKTLESGRFGNLTIKDHNRLSFQPGTGFRPPPLEISSIPVYCFSSPKTPPPSAATIPISGEICVNESIDFDEHCCYKRISFPELWAGPTYSNSPPASSLPIPKFSIRGNRTVSLELPTNSVEKIHPIVKSAPPSPTRGYTHPSSREPFHGADSATRTLRRILNLDVNSE
ncbi:uncharacterized protein LOC120086432 [Benincasa hispida]|uniref:uncharacterized protein LOC120086432 n=1 Tax=Benincasa hispida TaxID=102211 RepID=UPI001901FE85|nr:uncharacterized protein LOC120086432 [Benincasa hispida]